MTDAILEITDGTTTISFISPNTGFHLTAWVPAITDYKGGGTFQNPPLADWRQLRDSKWATASERFTLSLNGRSPDTAAFNLQEIRRLLEKANQYWTTDWQNELVWVKAKMKCETNARYCLVAKGRLENDQNYHDQPVTGGTATLEDLPLIIERRAWMSNIPNTTTNIAISAVETYDGVNFGNVDSSGDRTPVTTNTVYIANKRNTANLTNIHLTTAGANRIGAAVPYDIINATGETYFGIDTSVSDSGPFVSLVFDIGTAGAGAPTLAWEYWNGATWVTIPSLRDNTSDFTNTGVNSVHWNQPAAWATNSPGGGLPTGYWVRVRVSAGSFSTEPTQQNRDVYSVVWPYIEVQSSAIVGDISALTRILMQCQADTDGPGTLPALYSNRTLIGLRSYDRGSEFTAYINCADEQNPSGITVTLGTNCTFSTASAGFERSASGENVHYNPTGVETMDDRAIITFDSSIIQSFYGRFHAFVRVTLVGASDDFSLRLTITNTSGGVVITESAQVLQDSPVLDMGVVEIPGFATSSTDIPDQSIIAIQASADDASSDLYIHDLVLIPVDEWAIDTQDEANNTDSTVQEGRLLDIDSIIVPKTRTRTIVRKVADDTISANWQAVTNGPSIIQANARQKLWFFNMFHSSVGDDSFQSPIEESFTIRLKANQRYLSLRGNR